VTPAPDSPAGEVRLLVSSTAQKQQQQQQREEITSRQTPTPDMTSEASILLADATTQAAIAAAELARTEVETAHSPPAHRVGLLRFMRLS